MNAQVIKADLIGVNLFNSNIHGFIEAFDNVSYDLYQFMSMISKKEIWEVYEYDCGWPVCIQG